jgi:hypothetical protein
MDTAIIEGRSISKPPYWDGTTNFEEWKECIMIFMQSIDFKLWLVTKNGSKIPTSENFNDEDMKIMEQEAKAKYILRCALNPDALKRISGCQTAKEMWEKLNKLSVSYIQYLFKNLFVTISKLASILLTCYCNIHLVKH